MRLPYPKEGSLDLVMSDTDKQSTNSSGTTNHIPSTHESSFTKAAKRKLSLITDEPFIALPKRTKMAVDYDEALSVPQAKI